MTDEQRQALRELGVPSFIISLIHYLGWLLAMIGGF
jgi:hypothetical protein